MNQVPLKEVLYTSLKYITSSSKMGEYGNNPEKAIVVGAFANLGYSDLVHRVLEGSLREKSPYRMERFLHSTLMGYVESGNIKEALHLYKKYGEYIDRDDSHFLMILANNPLYEPYLLRCIPLISPNGKLNESLWNVFLFLWKSGRHETIGKIRQMLAEPLQRFIDLISGLYRNECHSGEEVGAILLGIFRNTEENMLWSMGDKIIDTLHNLGYSLGEIGKVLQFLKGALNRRSIGSFDLQRRLIHYYNEQGLFDRAYEFSEGIYNESILGAKYKYALKTKDKVLHGAYLEEYLKQTDAELAGLQQKLQARRIDKAGEETKKEEEGWDDERDDSWRTPYEIASIKAERYGEMAIYELLYGSEEKGREFINLMIESVEGIMEQIPNHAKKKHKGHIKGKIKAPLKRNLKEKFMLAGVFHYLPVIYGWNTPLLDAKIRGENQLIHRKHRELAYEERKKAEQKKSITERLPSIGHVRELLARNDKKALEKYLQTSEDKYTYHPLTDLWDIGIMIIEKYPDLYDQTRMAIGGYDREYGDFIPFFIRGMELGCISREDWEHFITPYLWGKGDNVGGNIDYRIHKIILPLIQSLLNIGKLAEAWELYMSLQSRIKDASEILKTFLLSVGNPSNPDPDNIAFASAESEQLERETVAYRQSYWHTRADVASMLSDDAMYQEAISKERDNLISRTDVPIASRTRGYVRTVVNNPLRSAHQIKDEITWILSSPLGKNEKARRRAVYHFMEKSIPGAEALGDIKKRSNPDRIQRFFFQKLVERKYITENVKYFLVGNWKENIKYLRRLLAQHQNDFSTVIDILVRKGAGELTALGMSRLEETGLNISSKQWDGVFITLRVVGSITPGVWEQALSVDFDEKKLAELSEKIKHTKELLFINEPMSDDIHPSLQAEIVYQAYRPVNMSYQGVMNMLGKVPDCSHHVSSYIFPEGGYDIHIGSRQHLTLRKNVAADTNIDLFFHRAKRVISPNVPESQEMARLLTDIGKLKVDGVNQGQLQDLVGVLFGKYIREQIFPLDEDRYKNLRAFSDFLGLYMEDNTEARIREFFEMHQEHTSKILTSFIESLNTEKRRRAVQAQLRIVLPDEISIELTIHIIAKAFLQKIRALSEMRSMVGKEVKKYVNQDGSEVSEGNIKLKAYVSKNTASFFAKASAGLCTSEDIELFKRKEYFHINIVDVKRQECVGNVMGYVIEYKGKKVLLLRGFNPNTAILKDIDVASFCESILEIAKEFAIANGFNSVYITENAGFAHTLSNRGEVVQYLMKKYGSNIAMGEDFTYSVSSSYTIGKIFPIFVNL